MKTPQARKWNDQAQAYSDMASSPVDDAYEYEINFPSILKLCPDNATYVLDLGSGDGVFTTKLAEKYEHVVGSDVSPNMVEIANNKFPNIEFKVIDLEDEFPQFDQPFDLIVIKLVLIFVDDLDNVALQCAKNLVHGGVVVFSVHHPFHFLNSYLLDKYSVKEKPSYRVMEDGYFSELPITKTIGDNADLEFNFRHRMISTYINTFANHGLLVDMVDEPKLTHEFTNKYPNFKGKEAIPSRLNVRFRKV